MTPDELRAIIDYLRERVRLGTGEADAPIVTTFDPPTEDEMMAAGLNAEGVTRLLGVPWWAEMVADVTETPDMCDPDDPPQQVLEYAKDVVSEYVRKRFPLESESR